MSADREWLRNLANSNFTNGHWMIDENKTRQLALSRLDETIMILFEEASEACEVFNAYSHEAKKINLIPIKTPDKQLKGLILLLGRIQLKLEFFEHRIGASLIIVQGFSKDSRQIHIFDPQFDAFGTLLWNMDRSTLLTPELMIKRLLEDLVCAAYETGEVTR